jgi:predicted AAA+ superfamily ATPase
MSSLSYAEKKGFKSKLFNPNDIKKSFDVTPDEIYEEIYKGGMPGYIYENLDRDDYFNDYITTYIERDVRNLTQVGDLLRFKKFLVAVAARNGEVLNYNSICEQIEHLEHELKN